MQGLNGINPRLLLLALTALLGFGRTSFLHHSNAQTPSASSSSSSRPPETNAHLYCHCHWHCCSSSPLPPRSPVCPHLRPRMENSCFEPSFLNRLSLRPRPRPSPPSCVFDPFILISISASRTYPPPPFARCRNIRKLNRRRSQLDLLIIKQSQQAPPTTNSDYKQPKVSTLLPYVIIYFVPYNIYITSQTSKGHMCESFWLSS